MWIADSSGERRNVRTLTAGHWCGELSLLTGKPRSASILATSNEVTLLMVKRQTFNLSVGDRIAKKRGDLLPFLQSVPLFETILDTYEMALLADAAQIVQFPAGTVIHESGKPSDNKFYIVRDGVVNGGGALSPKQYGRQQFFGHVELMQSAKNRETRKVSDAATCPKKTRARTLTVALARTLAHTLARTLTLTLTRSFR